MSVIFGIREVRKGVKVGCKDIDTTDPFSAFTMARRANLLSSELERAAVFEQKAHSGPGISEYCVAVENPTKMEAA